MKWTECYCFWYIKYSYPNNILLVLIDLFTMTRKIDFWYFWLILLFTYLLWLKKKTFLLPRLQTVNLNFYRPRWPRSVTSAVGTPFRATVSRSTCFQLFRVVTRQSELGMRLCNRINQLLSQPGSVRSSQETELTTSEAAC